MTDSPEDRPDDGAMIELNALLGQGTRYTGKLSFDGRIRIEGRFEGEIRGEVLVIGAGAELDGDIEVQVCIVTGGTVRANIRARDAIELHAPAVVIGDLHAPNVFIDRGVQFEGSCKMAPLDEATPAPRAVAETQLQEPELDEAPIEGNPIEEPRAGLHDPTPSEQTPVSTPRAPFPPADSSEGLQIEDAVTPPEGHDAP